LQPENKKEQLPMLTFIMGIAIVTTVYWFWIRPILKSRPELRELYQREESLLAALRQKLKGIKQKLSSASVIAASTAVTGYDFLEPVISGVDVTSLTSRVPSWAWPLIVISLTALFQFLRNLSDRRHAEERVEQQLVDPASAAGA
jgi:hypothetical protein